MSSSLATVPERDKISDTAAEAGRSVALFYDYYKTKAGLLDRAGRGVHAEATTMAVLPYRAGLAREDALREAVAEFAHLRQRRGELIGIFEAAMVQGRRDRWSSCAGSD